MTIRRASAGAGGCCACAQGATRIATAAMAAPAKKRRDAAGDANFPQQRAAMTTSIQARAILQAIWLFVCSGDGLIETLYASRYLQRALMARHPKNDSHAGVGSSNLKPTFCKPSSADLPYSSSISLARLGA